MQDRKAHYQFIEKCYLLYEQKMYQVAFRILRDEPLAEDAVQEAFLKLMKSDVCFKNVTSDDCKRYIITVIKNASITIYNKKKREHEVIYFSDRDDDFNTSPKMEDDAKQEMQEMIEKLPAKYREVVDCLVVKELSTKETAERLSISEANVRKRFERAKLLIRSMMKGSVENEEFKIV